MRGAAMSLTASGLVVFLLSMLVVQGQDGWGVTYTSTEICAVKGSTVEINCFYTYPSTWKDVVNTVGKTFWCTENKDEEHVDLNTVSEYAGRVEDRCENKTCTLRIKNLRESDSDVYKFRIETEQDKYLGEPGVTLFVTDLQVHVSRSRPNTRLQCLSSCHLPFNTSYIWFKKGQKIKEDTSPYAEISYDSADGYSCAVKGYEDFPSPSVLVHGLGSWSVTYTSTKICAVKGSTAEINCSYTYPSILKGGFNRVQNKFWFTKLRDGERVDLTTESKYAGRIEELCENNLCTLRINNLRESDSAEYMFRFTTNNDKYAGLPVTLSVTDLQVEVSRSGSDVNLQCLSSCPPGHTSYIWFKNGQEVKEDTSLYADFNYDSAESYTCALKGYEDFPSPSVYAPKLPSVSVSPSAEIEEGSSVTLTCSSDANPAANYTWYKANQTLFQGTEGSYHVTSISSEESGIYYCKSENQYGENNSTSLFVDVLYAPKLPSVSVRPSAEIEEGSSMTLTCSSDANPAANYTWYKEDEDSPKASGQIFNITDFRAEHIGSYSCGAQNKLGRSNSTLLQIVLTGARTSRAAGITTAVFLAVILLSIFLLIRKKKAVKRSSEPREPHSKQSPQEELLYANVQFSKNQADPLSSNIEDSVVYAEVKFNSAAPRSQMSATEDSTALYSTINKTRTQ